MEFSGKLNIGGDELRLSTGKLARQAEGAVKVEYGDTVVLTTACSEPDEKNLPFFPLTVVYEEMSYAAGKIPGGFFKREGAPSDLERVFARLTDRPIRPMFPEEYDDEVQVFSTVLSADVEHLPDILSIVGASASLMIADIPFQGPLGAVRIGRKDDRFLVNPTHEEIEQGELDLVVAGTRDNINMVEASANELPEELLLDAMDLAFEEIQDVIDLQDALIQQCQKDQTPFVQPEYDEAFEDEVKSAAREPMEEALYIPSKPERADAKSAVKDEMRERFSDRLEGEEDPERQAVYERSFDRAFDKLEKEIVREGILQEGKRIDGRGLDEIRPISIDVGDLPRTHGSSLFTRGETQSLSTVTLGTPSETQRIDNIYEESEKRFMLHYNFPPYSVGEVRRPSGPGRREIGHGLMAESALRPVLPDEKEFAYTIRAVSEILESNGSSSMATVCAGSLALMDAGVPVDRAVAGVGMGLVTKDDDYRILTDILGDEDHLGDMDFKVAGSREGVTSLQMDIKIEGVSRDILEESLERARNARMEILDTMDQHLTEPREKLSEYAPRLFTLQIPQDKIRNLIGPGGKNIRSITDETGANVDVEDDGTVFIGAEDEESADEARKRVEDFTREVEVGEIYEGQVVSTTDFGAFVEVLPGQEGLVHISELADHHVNETTDVLEEGDTVRVKCTGIGKKGIELSKREADKEQKSQSGSSSNGR